MNWPSPPSRPLVPLPLVAIGAAVLVVVLWSLLDGDGGGEQAAGNPGDASGTPLPGSSGVPISLPQSTPTPPLAAGEYEVVEGDSAWLIAEKLAVPLDVREAWIAELLALNGVDATELQIGATLILPPFDVSPSDATPATPTPDDGDTAAPDPEPADEEDNAGEDTTNGEDPDEESVTEPDEEDDDRPARSGDASIQVEGGTSSACSTIDGLTYCLGSNEGWSCTQTEGGVRCGGPSGQSTNCTGGGSSITCEGADGETLTCVDTGSSTVCSTNSTGTDETSDSRSQNCTRLGSATFCFGSNND